MKKLSNTEMLYGLIRNKQEAVAQIVEITVPELTRKVKYLRNDCEASDEPDSAIANVSFKKQLVKYRHEAIGKIQQYEIKFNEDTLLKRCLGDLFFVEVIWLCLESRIKINVSKMYLKFGDFKEKRELEVDNIYRLISVDTMEVLKNTLVGKPRVKHSNGLLFTICRNKVVDYLKQHINVVKTNNGNILTPTASGPGDINWETICSDLLEKILTRTEFEDFMKGANEKYEIIADALKLKAGLSYNERKILIFKLVSGESHKEISMMLGLDARTSKTLMSRAMRKIRAYLKDKKIGLNYKQQ